MSAVVTQATLGEKKTKGRVERQDRGQQSVVLVLARRWLIASRFA
jgi:hypothetical protein